MDERTPVGVVVAGGRGRRIGGDKAIVELDGVPLLHYPLAALQEVCGEVAVVAKRDTVLPPLRGAVEVWIEPDEPRHPLVGIVHALLRAGGRPILAVAVDLPLVDAATLRALARVRLGDAAAAVLTADGRLQPLCALYDPRALPGLSRFDPSARTTEIVAALGIVEVPAPDPSRFLNVNAPEDVLEASLRLHAAARAGGRR